MIQQALKKLSEKVNLNEGETFEIFSDLMEGKLLDSEIENLLVLLADKGETSEEISGAVKAMQKAMLSIHPKSAPLLDTCGTGGDCSNTFNISTASAFVAAGAGCKIAKHGNRAASSNCGSADVLEALGVNLDISPAAVESLIDEIGIGFMFARNFHPAMKNVANARKKIAKRTIFNILGPLTNPANASRRVLGVSDPNLLKKISDAMLNLGVEHALVVHGSGLDELNLCKNNAVYEIKNSEINRFTLDAADFGFNYCNLGELQVSSIPESAAAVKAVLSGKEKDAKRDIVLLNAGAAIYACGKADTIADAVTAAKDSIDSGRAMQKLEQLIEATKGIE